jgi:hypothetical protein
MKLKRSILVLSIVLLVLTPTVAAYSITEYNDAIIKTADRLVALQADITEDNAGNGSPDSDPQDGGWNWIIADTATGYVGTGPSSENLYGVTALCILAAHKINPKASYMTSMIDAYTGMNARSEVDSGPDMPFLVELSKITGNSAYASLAKARYDAKVTSYGDYNLDLQVDAKDLAWKIRDARHTQGWDGLIPWDIHLFIEAALALHQYFPGQGYDQDAVDMVDVVYNDMTGSPGYFDPTDSTENAYILGLAGGIEGFVKTGKHTVGGVSAYSLKNTLLSYQEVTGEWYEPTDPTDYLTTVQTTAYAVMALMAGGQIGAARKGAEWLISEQNSNGGWSGLDECPEIDSEAAQAIWASIPYPPPVGGFWVPVDKLELLAPYLGLASLLISTAAVSIVIIKRRKKPKS